VGIGTPMMIYLHTIRHMIPYTRVFIFINHNNYNVNFYVNYLHIIVLHSIINITILTFFLSAFKIHYTQMSL